MNNFKQELNAGISGIIEACRRPGPHFWRIREGKNSLTVISLITKISNRNELREKQVRSLSERRGLWALRRS